MNINSKELLGVIIISFFGVLTLVGLIQLALEPMPEVYKSWITKECKLVENSDEYTCNNLPPKYIVIWVE